MQYRGYTIQYSEDCCMVRDKNGKVIAVRENDTEAKDFIDELIDSPTIIKEVQTNWYEKFDTYCKHLPGKCYPTDDRTKFGTIYINALKKLIESFEKSTGVTVEYKLQVIDRENYYIVESVEKN